MTEVQERVIEVRLDSNEIVYVRRLSPLSQQILIEKAKAVFPPPDPKDYIKPLSDIAPNALEGVMIPADQNPEYAKALNAAKFKQNSWVLEQFLDMNLVVNTPEGREVTIARYASRLAAVRQHGELPPDEWKATVLHGLMTTWHDRTIIGNAATGLLTGEEVRLAMTTFWS